MKYRTSINNEVLSEATDPSLEISYIDIGGVDAVAGVTDVKQMSFEDAPSRARRIVRDGDTIVSTVRTYLGAIAPMVDPRPHTIVSTGFAVLRPRKISPRYLAYAARERGFIGAIVARSVGVSYPAVNAAEIGDLPIPIPPASEQAAIAAFLDRETARIDALIEKKRTLIERLKEKRSALISRTVTRGLPPQAAKAAGLSPHPRMKDSGVEWLGEVPEHWEVVPLRRIASLRSGESITAEELLEGGDFPVFGGNGVRGFFDGYTHEGEYVLIGRQGALCGNINYASGRFWASEHAVVVSPTREIAPLWLGELLREMKLNQFSLSAAQPGLSVDRILALKIPVPPLHEQQALATFLSAVISRTARVTGAVEAAIDRLSEYRAALITAAVTGMIDVREAAA